MEKKNERARIFFAKFKNKQVFLVIVFGIGSIKDTCQNKQ